jgi:signal transduction histidine kinase
MTNLEDDILKQGLIIGVMYQFYQAFLAVFVVVSIPFAVINLATVVVLFMLYKLVDRVKNTAWIALGAHILACGGFTFFWKTAGGLAGTVPSFLCLYTAFLTSALSGVLRTICIVSFVGLVTFYFLFPNWLGMETYFEPEKIIPWQKAVDYLVIAGIIIAFSLLLKKRFLRSRDMVAKRNQQLEKLARMHVTQNQELALRQEETRAINDNLESIVRERTKESERRTRELSEYAFINAHMLRGPLCRIIGLIHIMEKSPELYPPEKLQEVKRIAEEIDAQIKEINFVVSKT